MARTVYKIYYRDCDTVFGIAYVDGDNRRGFSFSVGRRSGVIVDYRDYFGAKQDRASIIRSIRRTFTDILCSSRV